MFLSFLLLVGFFDDKDFDSYKRIDLPWFDKSRKNEIWNYLNESALKLQQIYPMARPNLDAAFMVMEKNIDYLAELLAHLEEEEARRRRLAEEKALRD